MLAGEIKKLAKAYLSDTINQEEEV
jgi:hypothetical protein